jgi:hypothetical protein
MKNRALLSVLALSLLAAACDSQKTAEPPKPQATAAVVPLPPAAAQAPAASANQDAKPVQLAQSDTKQAETMALKPACKQGNNCTVELTVTGTTGQNCKITKDRPKLHVARGHAETIHWKITNATGAAAWDFDANGVDFSGNSAFTCSANGSRKYKCEDKNPEATHTQHHYTVKLKAGNQTCNNDPMIVNGADEQNQEP